jgi:hypothetical protein
LKAGWAEPVVADIGINSASIMDRLWRSLERGLSVLRMALRQHYSTLKSYLNVKNINEKSAMSRLSFFMPGAGLVQIAYQSKDNIDSIDI